MIKKWNVSQCSPSLISFPWIGLSGGCADCEKADGWKIGAFRYLGALLPGSHRHRTVFYLKDVYHNFSTSKMQQSPPYRFLHQRCALLCTYNRSSITFLPFSTSKLHSTTFNVSFQHTISINYQSDPHTTVLWNTGYSTERRERSPQWEWSTVKCVLEICPETLRSPRLHVWVSEFIKKEVSSSSIFF